MKYHAQLAPGVMRACATSVFELNIVCQLAPGVTRACAILDNLSRSKLRQNLRIGTRAAFVQTMAFRPYSAPCIAFFASTDLEAFGGELACKVRKALVEVQPPMCAVHDTALQIDLLVMHLQLGHRRRKNLPQLPKQWQTTCKISRKT